MLINSYSFSKLSKLINFAFKEDSYPSCLKQGKLLQILNIQKQTQKNIDQFHFCQIFKISEKAYTVVYILFKLI